jgi:uncharacterized protein (DUF1015 family)
MAEIRPLTALHYDLARVGPLDRVLSPPYDVIDPGQRAELAARSPYNVVRVDLPEAAEGGDPYASAAATLAGWRDEGAVVLDVAPALWALTQEFVGPDGERRTRSGFLCAVRVEDYGGGRIRPHERTHPGPKEDRLRLTRATRTNLSPIFALYDDPRSEAWSALASATAHRPFGEAVADDGSTCRLWRVGHDDALEAVEEALDGVELLIADGHHRYETARVYAEEVGGEGPHRWVLMCLVALQDPGLAIFPTHRLVRGLDGSERQEALAEAIRRDFEVEEVDRERLVPEPAADGKLRIGYMDSHFRRAYRLTLKDPAILAAALPDHSEAYRSLDTAVVETLLLRGALGMSEDDIAHLKDLGYARDTAEALRMLDEGAYQAGFFMGPVPVEQVQAVAAAGESMPPKSTFFMPKIPTGLVFNPL